MNKTEDILITPLYKNLNLQKIITFQYIMQLNLSLKK